MTEAERINRGIAAKRALDEFLEPAIAVIEQEYGELMIKTAASSDPRATDVIARLANGVKVARQIRSQITALVLDGEMAKGEKDRAARIEELSKPKQRLLKVAPL